MSKRGYSCAVRSCTTKNDGRTSFFRFPKDLSRCQEWLKLCSRQELSTKDIEYLHRNLRVCAKHFTPQMFLNDLHNRLQPHALPVLYVANVLADIIIPQSVPSTSRSQIPKSSVNFDEICESKLGNIDNMPGSSASPPSMSIVATQTPQGLSSSSPRKLKLRAKTHKLQEEVRSLKKRKLEMKCEATFEHFSDLCLKFLPPTTANFVISQVNMSSKTPHGRRYTDEYKQFAMRLYFASPRAYKVLEKTFTLPAIRTLQRRTSLLDFKTGFNDFVFEALKLKMASLDSKQRVCSVVIDEMSIKASLFYNISKDEIIGFHDEGDGKKFMPAQTVLVVMARGLYAKWKQPLAFFFTNTVCKGTRLKCIVAETIIKLRNVSCVNPLLLVTDQGSNFSDLTSTLGVTASNPYFFVDARKVFFMFDPPHLIKSVRNNLREYDIHYNEKVASWDPIKNFYESDKNKPLRMASKLTNSHINPTKFEKMRVKLATQVISETVAIGISTYVSLGALPSSAEGTATFLEKFDKLFDLFNSTRTKGTKKYNLAFMGSEYQMDFLNEMIELLKTIRIKQRHTNKDMTRLLKCFQGWCISINCLKQLWAHIKDEKFQFLLTRRLSQDCLENFFGAVRGHGGNSTNPTPQQFINIFKNIFGVNYIEHNANSNCEDDSDKFLNEASILNVTSDKFYTGNIEKGGEAPFKLENCTDFRELDLLSENVLSYVCGYLFKKCLKIHVCTVCTNQSKATQDLSSETIMCYFKAYETESKSTFGNLLMPDEAFVNFVRQLELLFESFFEEFSVLPNVGSSMLQVFNSVDYNPPCNQFPKDYVMKLFCRMRIYHSLKYANAAFRSIPRKQRKTVHILNL